MKKILVPTDFSEHASYATELAIALAEFYKAELFLFHQLDLPDFWNKLPEDEKLNYPEAAQRMQEAQQHMDPWKKVAEEAGVQLHVRFSTGKLTANIQELVTKESIDFVVMGSHGASGFNAFLIGSNTQRAIRNLHCPVLIIKNQIKEYAIHKVIFASNFDPEEKKAFEYLLKFVTPFKAEIHLVEINTSSWYSQPFMLVVENMNAFKQMCKHLPCHLHFYRDGSIETGIQRVAEEIGADLIAISNHQRSPVKRVFSGSNVEGLVNHSKLPVLSIDYLDEAES